MDTPTHAIPRLTVALVAALALVVSLLAATPAASASARCEQRFTAGRPPGITLRAYDLSANDISCSRARAVVAAFLDRKLRQSSERCAGAAETPPYRGCVVEGYRCRATSRPRLVHGRPIVAQECRDGRRDVRFTESDSSAN